MVMVAHGFRASDEPDAMAMEPEESALMSYSVVPFRTTSTSVAAIAAAVVFVVAIAITVIVFG